MNQVLINGEIVNREQAKIDIEDRAFQFGDGIYEVIRVYNGKLYQLDEHLIRLKRSADEIHLSLPFTLEDFSRKIKQLTQDNQLEDGIVYTQVSRGAAPRYHGFPSADVRPQFVAYTRAMPRPEANLKQGIKALLVEDIRWLRCDIKSLNLLPNVIAKQQAGEAGAFEAIQHRGDTVTEGSSSNVFMIKEGILYTHPATSLILNGITRTTVIELCGKLGFTIREEAFSVEQLLAAEEVFITSTTSEITPVVQINGQQIGSGTPGPITVQLQQSFVQSFSK